jgi:hypothetical protein
LGRGDRSLQNRMESSLEDEIATSIQLSRSILSSPITARPPDLPCKLFMARGLRRHVLARSTGTPLCLVLVHRAAALVNPSIKSRPAATPLRFVIKHPGPHGPGLLVAAMTAVNRHHRFGTDSLGTSASRFCFAAVSCTSCASSYTVLHTRCRRGSPSATFQRPFHFLPRKRSTLRQRRR